MPCCQAYGCTNRTDRTKKQKKLFPHLKISFFRIPRPRPSNEKTRAERWLHNIGTGKSIQSFSFTKDKVVCGTHFHEKCFKRNLQAELLGYVPKARFLKDGAIPTIFAHKIFDVINMDGETVPPNLSNKKSRKRKQNKVNIRKYVRSNIEEELCEVEQIIDSKIDQVNIKKYVRSNIEEELCEVEQIIDSKIDKATKQYRYRIRWKGYGPESDTWEPTKHLTHCRDLLKMFKEERRRQKLLKKQKMAPPPIEIKLEPVSDDERG